MDPFQVAGLALLVTAIVGGGLQAAGQTIPVITSPIRQILLGIVGIVLMLSGSEDVRAVALGLVKPQATQVAQVATAPPTATLAPTLAPTAAPSATVPPTAAPTAVPSAVPTSTAAPIVARQWCRPTLATDAIAIHARPTTSSQWLGTVDAPSGGQQSEATVIGWTDAPDSGSVPWLRISAVRNGPGEFKEIRGWVRSREPGTPSGWVDMDCSFDSASPPFPLPKLSPND